MANRKYEFTGEVKTFLGVTLKQIRAVVDFGTAAKGEVGGWIEKEKNLDVSGDAWVYGDAQVSGDAWVSGDARVYGDAQVYGDARVYGNAQVYGDAWVYGDARVYGNAQVYGDAWVYGDAQVSGDAWVYGNARVSGDAWVYGDARVYGNAQVYGDAWVYGDAQVSGDADFFFVGPIGSRKAQFTVHADAKIGVRFTTGCFSGSEKEFRKAIKETHGNNEHANVYLSAINLALMVVKEKEAK